MPYFWYREHRSGLKVPTNIQHQTNRRDALIGCSAEQSDTMAMACCQAGLFGLMLRIHGLWRLYDKEELVDRLNVLCPGHGFTKRSHKTPMLILWMQNEDMKNNPEVMRKIRKYPEDKLFGVPTHRKAKKIHRKKRHRKKRNWTKRRRVNKRLFHNSAEKSNPRKKRRKEKRRWR